MEPVTEAVGVWPHWVTEQTAPCCGRRYPPSHRNKGKKRAAGGVSCLIDQCWLPLPRLHPELWTLACSRDLTALFPAYENPPSPAPLLQAWIGQITLSQPLIGLFTQTAQNERGKLLKKASEALIFKSA